MSDPSAEAAAAAEGREVRRRARGRPAHEHQSETKRLAAAETPADLRNKDVGLTDGQHPVELDGNQLDGILAIVADRQRLIAIDRDGGVVEFKTRRCALPMQPGKAFAPDNLFARAGALV